MQAHLRTGWPTVCGLAVLAVVLAAGLLAAPARSAHSLPKLLGSSADGKTRGLLVRPAEILYTGDGSGVLGGFDGTGNNGSDGHLKWSKWTQTQALGSGAVWLNNCTPSCAAGRFAPHAVTVRAFRPSGGVFTRLTVTYVYAGKNVVDRRTLEKTNGFWDYGVISP